MNELKDQIESPSGLDLNPSPPPTARISKKVGLVAIGVVVLVGTLVVYGLYTRKRQQAVALAVNEEKHPEPARIAGDQVVREIAPPPIANPAPVPTGIPEFGGAIGDPAISGPALRPPSISLGKDRPERGHGGGSGNRASGYASAEGELSAEERLRLAAFREEQQAIAAPTSIHGNGALAVPPSSFGSDPLQQCGPLASLLAGGNKERIWTGEPVCVRKARDY